MVALFSGGEVGVNKVWGLRTFGAESEAFVNAPSRQEKKEKGKEEGAQTDCEVPVETKRGGQVSCEIAGCLRLGVLVDSVIHLQLPPSPGPLLRHLRCAAATVC